MSHNPQIHILLAEDEAPHVEAMRRVFEAGSTTSTLEVVGSLKAYREAVAVRVPTLALVDLNLSDGSAVEILTSPAEEGLFPVVVMTSQSTEEVAVQAIKAGALDYVVKSPEAFAAMPRIVERALREWKLRQAHRRAEIALRESHQIFEQFMAHSPIYVFFKDENIRALRLSRNFEQMLGKPLGELLGRTMDEIFPSDLARSMIEDDKRILAEGKPCTVEETLNGRHYTTIKFPIFNKGVPKYLAGYTIDITERYQNEAALRQKNAELEEALARVKALSGLLPICAGCKKIRDDHGYWSQVESYIQEHSEATFTHGLCPGCIERYFPGMDDESLLPNTGPASGPSPRPSCSIHNPSTPKPKT